MKPKQSFRFFANDLKPFHPLSTSFTTDAEYAQVANRLYAAFLEHKLNAITTDEMIDYARRIALYFEDVVANAGIWRSFVTRMKELTGRSLPFYDVDEDTYFPDEPHKEDIQLLIWLTHVDWNSNELPDPHDEFFDKLAQVAIDLLDEMFDTIGINEQLVDVITDPANYTECVKRVELHRWIYLSCYLTGGVRSRLSIKETAEEMVALSDSPIYDIAAAICSFRNACGPLALQPKEWLAMLLRANDAPQTAIRVEAQQYLPLYIYKCLRLEGNDIVLLTPGEKEIRVNRSRMFNPNIQPDEYALAQFLWYDGLWTCLGGGMMDDADEHFQQQFEEVRQHKALVRNYAQLMEQSGGSPFFYFANLAEAKDFLVENGVIEKANMEAQLHMKALEKAEDIILYFPSENEAFHIIPNVATSIKDARNPFYDAEKARNNGFAILLDLPGSMVKHLIAHQLVPDISFSTRHDKNYNRRMAQQNLDFLARTFTLNNYADIPYPF